MIAAVNERCAGIDVGKTFLVACTMVGAAHADPEVQQRTYGTTTRDLEQLRDWLVEQGCTHVAMESTGSYWKPVFNVLEQQLTVLLANPQDVKARKGHKTDHKDSWWLAHLLRRAMIRPSFVPPRAVRELRDLTRRRKQLLHDATSERNRVQKILEDANVKLGTVLTDLFGVSGQLMLHALMEGKASSEQIAEFAKGRARQKIPDIIAAVEGHTMSSHHRRMIRSSLDHMAFLEKQISDIDEQILKQIEASGFDKEFELVQTVPGIQSDSAAAILAEIGPDMRVFPSAKHISSWAGVCPGNRRSAGKNQGGRTTRGSRWLRGMLTQCAWAAAARKDCYLKGKFWRLAAQGRKQAVVAITHTLLVIIYNVLSTEKPYEEILKPALDERQKKRLIRHHTRCLGKLGVSVGFTPKQS